MQSRKDSKTSLDTRPSTDQDGLKLVERVIKLSIIWVVFCFQDDKGGYMNQLWFKDFPGQWISVDWDNDPYLLSDQR